MTDFSNDISSTSQLHDALRKGIIILDGAMGTMIQRFNLNEADFHCEAVPEELTLKGCNDILCISRPDIIEAIHDEYLQAGARIIETDSFNANAFSLADYGLSTMVADINFAAATVARKAADKFMTATGEKVWVAGSMGPTGVSLTMSGSIDERSTEKPDFDSMEATYFEQVRALINGGVDLLLIETVFDGLNAKAAISGSRRAMQAIGRDVEIIISVTLMESGRTLAGQTLEGFVESIHHAKPLAIGLNCGFGASTMKPFIERLSGLDCAVSVYPNAGLPNELGQYDETPEIMASSLRPMFAERLINIVGGCCGTTPAHIRAIAAEAAKHEPRKINEREPALRLAGLEKLELKRESGKFTVVGERCNVAGSRKFLRLIKEGSIDEAIEIAATQVAAGADIIDINMDDGMLDASEAMITFLRKIAVEPDVARVPVMIDSSDFNVIVKALKTVQGRAIVNSISLKEGPEKFLEKALEINRLGASMVVMAFDEKGQADSFERRIEVCQRAYSLLTGAGIPADDIIFDPNILAVATGMEEHADYAWDFIRATQWIKTNLPGARVSGGLSNLSFSFRGNNKVREAMHAVFLDHAIKAGLDMAIVNPSTMMKVGDIEPELREAVEDVLVGSRSNEATDRLIEIAARIAAEAAAAKGKTGKTPRAVPEAGDSIDLLAEMVVKGKTEGLEGLLDDAVGRLGTAMAVIDGPLMAGMNRVGDLFGKGIMFLPQVVKSARTMKKAVAVLTPLIEKEKAAKNAAGKVVIATVKGDVHDIGKNIVDVIMNCNGFEMIDLGVMVPAEEIVERAIAEQADFIGLSGLITPSLEEMCRVARLMEEKGLRIPLLIGGATTSALHTAVKIAPCYGGPVVYTRDAAALPGVAQTFANDPEAAERNRKEQAELRRNHNGESKLISYSEAVGKSPKLEYSPVAPRRMGVSNMEFSIAQLRPIINRRAFLSAWGLDASLTTSIDHPKNCECCGDSPKISAAKKLWEDAGKVLDELADSGITTLARTVVAKAGRDNNGDIILEKSDGSKLRFPILRSQTQPKTTVDILGASCVAVSDFLAPVTSERLTDYCALFAVTAGEKIKTLIDEADASGDNYRSILLQSIADRLAEASTELMHRRLATEIWGFAKEETDPKGIRPAFGYPSLPDQSLVLIADEILRYSDLGITITENGALSPQATTTGLVLAHPLARYTSVGKIGADQREAYSSRHPFGANRIDFFLPDV